MARKKLTGIVLVGVIVLLAAIFATRIDLAALLVADTSSSLQPNKALEAAADKPATPAAEPARSAERAQPAPEVRTAKATDAARPAKATEAPRSAPEVDRTPNSDGTKFDVVRIDPDGASVFAGRAPPHSRVTVYANDEPVTAATANAAGEWVSVIERPFPTGEVKLSLKAQPAGKVGTPALESAGQSVRITIAASPPRPAATGTRLATPARAAPTPSPITFVYDQDTFTDLGRKEAAVLREFLRQSHLESITLSGHADSRGSDEYNMELSRRRLEQVARFLREAGYTGKVVLDAKGKREPFSAPGREQLPKEDAFQLDRRVELRANR